MIIIFILLLTVAIIFVVSAVLSFAARKRPLRRGARITAISIVALVVVIAGGVLLAMRIFFGPAPPTIAELQRSFPREKNDLELIVRMSDEDSTFFRIDPEWVDQGIADGQPEGRFMKGDPKITLPEARWNQYRAIYRRNDIRLGIQRNGAHDAFIMVNSIGLLERGHISGFVYCNPTKVAGVTEPRYEPCELGTDSGSHNWDGVSSEGYQFQRLADRWYAYDQGPG